MLKFFVVFIFYNLGQVEVMWWFQGGMVGVKLQFGEKVVFIYEIWSGNWMDFCVGVMGQNVSGYFEVMQDQVCVEV